MAQHLQDMRTRLCRAASARPVARAMWVIALYMIFKTSTYDGTRSRAVQLKYMKSILL